MWFIHYMRSWLLGLHHGSWWQLLLVRVVKVALVMTAQKVATFSRLATFSRA
jgi:hypothetical protein